MQIILFDINRELTRAWAETFSGDNLLTPTGNVTTLNASLADLLATDKVDALVSPANSFGIMDGGIDLAIRDSFKGLQEAVTDQLKWRWEGFQPPGSAELIQTPNAEYNVRYLVHAPTMRWPMRIADPLVVYDAMRSILLTVSSHNEECREHGMDYDEIKMLAIPGLGTATGGIPPQQAARLMKAAYMHFERGTSVAGWQQARLIANQIYEAS